MVQTETDIWPQPTSVVIARLLVLEALRSEETEYVYSPRKVTPQPIREYVLDFLKKNVQKNLATISNVRCFIDAIWDSVLLELGALLDKFPPGKEKQLKIANNKEITLIIDKSCWEVVKGPNMIE